MSEEDAGPGVGADFNGGMMVYRIGGHTFSRNFRSGCRVCSSELRDDIEIKIASGVHYTTIAQGLPEDCGLEAKHLSAHFRGNHMPLRQAAVRRIMDDRQAELGKALEDGVDQIADHVSLARVVVNRSFQAIAEGRLEPTVADGIAAARILQQTGVNDEETDKASYVQAFVIYMQNAQRIMSPEQFVAFGQSLSVDPVLKGLVARHQNQN